MASPRLEVAAREQELKTVRMMSGWRKCSHRYCRLRMRFRGMESACMGMVGADSEIKQLPGGVWESTKQW